MTMQKGIDLRGFRLLGYGAAAITTIFTGTAAADTLTVTFRVPVGVGAQNVAISGTEGVRINDRAEVRLLTGGDAIVATSGNGEMNIGVEAQVDSLFASDNVVLRDRSLVTGDVYASGQVDRNDTVSVLGDVEEFASVQFVDIEVEHDYQPSNHDLFLEPDQVAALSPGSYGRVVVKSRAELYLDPGVYDIAELQLEPQAIVYVSNHEEATELWVRDRLLYKGRFVESAGARSPGNTLVVYTGSDPVSLEGPFSGTLHAPRADVSVSGGTRHVASVHGRTVEVHQGARIQTTYLRSRVRDGDPQGSFEIHSDDIVGGSGTESDPYLVHRDNPRLTGHFDLIPGESAWGGRYGYPNSYADDVANWVYEAAPGRFFVALLRATSGFELHPSGPFVSVLPMIPTGEYDGEVRFDFRGFTLEPGKLYRLEAEMARDDLDALGVYVERQEIWVKLAPEVHVYPFFTIRANWSPNVGPMTAHNSSILLDYELETFSNARPSVEANWGWPTYGHHDLMARDIDVRNYYTAAMFASMWDGHPDDVWATCADLTSNGGLPQLQAVGVTSTWVPDDWNCGAMTAAISDPLADPVLRDPILGQLNLGTVAEVPDNASWHLLGGYNQDCGAGGEVAGNIGFNAFYGMYYDARESLTATYFFETVTGLSADDAPPGTPFNADAPGSDFPVDWCLAFESLPDYTDSAWEWLDEPPWVVCRHVSDSGYPALGDVTITTNHRCGGMLNGTVLRECPDPNDYGSCFQIDLSEYYAGR